MIVAVAGGKGGVGKSTTAWNLGHELEAVVVDADLSTADLPPASGPDLHDALAGRAEPRAVVDAFADVSYVPSGRTLSGARAARLDVLPSVLERLDREFEYVLVDCPAGLARDVGTTLGAADVAVLVTVPAEPAVLDAARTGDLAANLETPVASVVVNMADRASQAGLCERFGRHLGAPAELVEADDEVAAAQERWRPVSEYAPSTQAVEAFRTVARRLEAARERLATRATVR